MANARLSQNLRGVIEWLYKDGAKWRRSLDSNDWRADAADTISAFYKIFQNENDFRHFMPDGNCQEVEFEKRLVVIKPPVDDKSVFPTLHCSWGGLDTDTPRIRLCLGLFVRVGKGMRFFGQRFEAPHGPGDHNYYHAQPITGFNKNDEILQRFAPRWLPDSYPAVPILCEDPFELTALMLVSLYGQSILNQLRLLSSRNVIDGGAAKSVNNLIKRIS
tara:strand:- start:2463 stop:3116 length:654 start_codon:yes stop_codon:yes gene_type:complete